VQPAAGVAQTLFADAFQIALHRRRLEQFNCVVYTTKYVFIDFLQDYTFNFEFLFFVFSSAAIEAPVIMFYCMVCGQAAAPSSSAGAAEDSEKSLQNK
jgi:hypothetical protein